MAVLTMLGVGVLVVLPLTLCLWSEGGLLHRHR
jgi:hypothetical protein